jgi:hypothetical protein
MMPPANPLPKNPPGLGVVGWAAVCRLCLAAGFDVDGLLLKERPPPRERASVTSTKPVVKNRPVVKTAVTIIFVLETLIS